MHYKSPQFSDLKQQAFIIFQFLWVRIRKQLGWVVPVQRLSWVCSKDGSQSYCSLRLDWNWKVTSNITHARAWLSAGGLSSVPHRLWCGPFPQGCVYSQSPSRAHDVSKRRKTLWPPERLLTVSSTYYFFKVLVALCLSVVLFLKSL